MDCLMGLCCPLSSRCVQPMESASWRSGKESGVKHLFSLLPSCCLNEVWLHSYRVISSYSFSSSEVLYSYCTVVVTISPPSAFRSPTLAVPGCHALPYWLTSTLLIFLQILPTSCNSPPLHLSGLHSVREAWWIQVPSWSFAIGDVFRRLAWGPRMKICY